MSRWSPETGRCKSARSGCKSYRTKVPAALSHKPQALLAGLVSLVSFVSFMSFASLRWRLGLVAQRERLSVSPNPRRRCKAALAA
jgi:hypothetical protein